MSTATMGSTLNELVAEVSAVSLEKLELILVADDHVTGLELMRVVLEDSGYMVCGVTDGATAVRYARLIVPDLIIVDLDMPGLDGFGVLRQLRSEPRLDATPVAALSAYSMDENLPRALAAGFAAYFPKPISLQKLRTGVAQLLKTRAAALSQVRGTGVRDKQIPAPPPQDILTECCATGHATSAASVGGS